MMPMNGTEGTEMKEDDMEEGFNWEAFSHWMSFGYLLAMLINFYAGYCCKKAWGRWGLFYAMFQSTIFNFVMGIIMLIVGKDTMAKGLGDLSKQIDIPAS